MKIKQSNRERDREHRDKWKEREREREQQQKLIMRERGIERERERATKHTKNIVASEGFRFGCRLRCLLSFDLAYNLGRHGRQRLTLRTLVITTFISYNLSFQSRPPTVVPGGDLAKVMHPITLH